MLANIYIERFYKSCHQFKVNMTKKRKNPPDSQRKLNLQKCYKYYFFTRKW